MSRRGPTAIPRPHTRCKKQNGVYTLALSQPRNGPHEREGLWKCRPGGRRGKPKAGFPPRPQSLEIANGAIPTFPQPRDEEQWKTKSTFPTVPLAVYTLQTGSERRPSGGSLRSRLQAHYSMRKCSCPRNSSMVRYCRASSSSCFSVLIKLSHL